VDRSSILTGELTPESDLGDAGPEASDKKSLPASWPWCKEKSLEFFSRRACEVFSKLLGTPMSYQSPVSRSFARNRPGGSVL
jgi:hypothetical protein